MNVGKISVNFVNSYKNSSLNFKGTPTTVYLDENNKEIQGVKRDKNRYIKPDGTNYNGVRIFKDGTGRAIRSIYIDGIKRRVDADLHPKRKNLDDVQDKDWFERPYFYVCQISDRPDVTVFYDTKGKVNCIDRNRIIDRGNGVYIPITEETIMDHGVKISTNTYITRDGIRKPYTQV